MLDGLMTNNSCFFQIFRDRLQTIVGLNNIK